MPASYWTRNLSSIALAMASTLVAGASWAFYPILTAPKGDAVQLFGQLQSPGLSHVSAALSGLDFFIPQNSYPHLSNDDDLPARVGIEVES